MAGAFCSLAPDHCQRARGPLDPPRPGAALPSVEGPATRCTAILRQPPDRQRLHRAAGCSRRRCPDCRRRTPARAGNAESSRSRSESARSAHRTGEPRGSRSAITALQVIVTCTCRSSRSLTPSVAIALAVDRGAASMLATSSRACSGPAGEVPQIGDGDDGRALPFPASQLGARERAASLLAVGAQLLRSPAAMVAAPRRKCSGPRVLAPRPRSGGPRAGVRYAVGRGRRHQLPIVLRDGADTASPRHAVGGCAGQSRQRSRLRRQRARLSLHNARRTSTPTR